MLENGTLPRPLIVPESMVEQGGINRYYTTANMREMTPKKGFIYIRTVAKGVLALLDQQ